MLIFEGITTLREVLGVLAAAGAYLVTNNMAAPFVSGAVAEVLLCHLQREAADALAVERRQKSRRMRRAIRKLSALKEAAVVKRQFVNADKALGEGLASASLTRGPCLLGK